MVRAEVQLGRVEALRAVRGPVLWLAVGLSAVMVAGASDASVVHLQLTGYALLPVMFVAMITIVFAVRRGTRSGTEELLGVLPVGADRRSLAFGITAVASGVLALALTVAGWLYVWPSSVLGTAGIDTLPPAVLVPRPNMAQFLQGPMAMVVFCALGVALARWLPAWLVLLSMVVPAMVLFLWFGFWMGEGLSPVSWSLPLATGWVHGEWIGCGETDWTCVLQVSGFDTVTPWWHLGYLAALAVLLVTIAVLRHRRDRAAWLAFGLALAVTVLLAAAQASVFERYQVLT